MAYSSGAVRLLIDLHKRKILKGSVLEIGASQIGADVTVDDINAFNAYFGCDASLTPKMPVSRLFAAAGFTYRALDLAPKETSIIMDLNTDELPGHLHGQFDTVINIGTTEHVSNQGHAFKIIHDSLKPGGYCVNAVPGLGLLNHGLVTYSPKFFVYLCRVNLYEITEWRIAVQNREQDLSQFGLKGIKYPCGTLSFIYQKIVDSGFRYPSDTDNSLAMLGRKWEAWREYVKQP
jgi:SAM-dependent methyltransferase